MKKKLLLINILILCVFSISAQNGFTSYQMTPLTYSYNTNLRIDALGNKWLSTFNKGVYKFDGVNWTTYDTINSGIASNRVNDIAFESSTISWFSTHNGVSKFDGTNWTNYNTGNSNLPNDTILSIYINNSDIWIGTNNGLALFDGITWTVYNTSNSGLINNVVTSVNKDLFGDIWIGTANGLCVKSGNNWTTYNVSNSNIPQDKISSIYIDNSVKWIGTLNSGLFKFENSSFTPLESLFFNIPIGSVPDIKNVRSISRGPQGGVLINSFCEILPNQIHKYEIFPTLGFYTFAFQAFDISTGLVWATKLSGANTIYSFNYTNYTGTTILTELPNYKTLDVNEVRAGLFNQGDMFWDLYGSQSPKYEVPKYSGKNANFASALWIGGIDDDGALHQAAQTYRQEVVNYFPGPLDTLLGSTDSIVSNNYNKIWKIDRLNIQEFQSMFANGSVQNGTYSVNNDIITWPAQGTGNYTRNMAPFVDVNGDGLYNPILDGDYPKISGDQMCYWIFNDSINNFNSPHGTPSLQVEIHASAYAYSCSQIDDSLKALNYTTFYNYEIFNRSNNNYSNAYVGIWDDITIGSFDDNFLGCNTNYNYGFHYNGLSVDGNESLGCYGSKPPMLATVILNGPLAQANDNIDNNNDGIIDEQGEKNLMTHFISIDNTSSDSINGIASSGLGAYNYLSGKWRNGLPLTYGGNGIAGTSPHDFMFDGIPAGNNWDEVSLNNAPGHRGFVLGCGPFNLNINEHVNFNYALVYTRDTISPYSPANLFNKNLEDVKKIKQWYSVNNYPSCYDTQTEIKNVKKDNYLVTLYPNPSSYSITVSLSDEFRNSTIEIYSITGQKIQSITTKNMTEILDVSSFKNGLYFITFKNTERRITKKFIKQ